MMISRPPSYHQPQKQACYIKPKGQHQSSSSLSSNQKAHIVIISTRLYEFQGDSLQYGNRKQISQLFNVQFLSSIRVAAIETNGQAKCMHFQKTCIKCSKYFISFPQLEQKLWRNAEKIINCDLSSKNFQKQLLLVLLAVKSTKKTLHQMRQRFMGLCESGQVDDTDLGIQYLDFNTFESYKQDRKQFQNIIDKTISTGDLIMARNQEQLRKIYFFYTQQLYKLIEKQIFNHQRFDLLIEAIFFLLTFLKIYYINQKQQFLKLVLAQQLQQPYEELYYTISKLLNKKQQNKKPNKQYIERNFYLILVQLLDNYRQRMNKDKELEDLLTIQREIRKIGHFSYKGKLDKIIDRIMIIKKNFWIEVYEFMIQEMMIMNLVCCKSKDLFLMPRKKQQFEINPQQTKILQFLQTVNYRFNEDNLEIPNLQSFFKSHISNLAQIIETIEIQSIKDRDFLKIKCLYGFCSYLKKKQGEEYVHKLAMSGLYNAVKQKLQLITRFVQNNKEYLNEEDLLQINGHILEFEGLSTKSSSENDNFNFVHHANNLAPEDNGVQPMNNHNNPNTNF